LLDSETLVTELEKIELVEALERVEQRLRGARHKWTNSVLEWH